jgi:ribose transport system permease protein
MTSIARPTAAQQDGAPMPDAAVPERTAPPLASATEHLKRYGLLVGLVVVVGVFSALRPSTFPTWSNVQTTLVLAAPLLVVAAGLTVVLVMQDFDLSIGGMIGLGGAVAIALMSKQGMAWPPAVAIALLVGVGVGCANGFLIGFLGLSSFIVTLAMGTVLLGGEYLITGQKTIFEGVPTGYADLATTEVAGLPLQVWVALVFSAVIYLFLHQSEMGRYMHAIGSNREAARLAGVNTASLRLVGFAVVAVSACIAAVLLTSQSGASTPNAGASFLLPAFASVFLGTAVFRLGQFNLPGTVVGVLFLSIIQVGLTMVDLSTAVVNIVQGVILIVAVSASGIASVRS